MKLLLLPLLWLDFIGISSHENSIFGIETRSTNQPGVFYEKTMNVRFINRHWKLIIMVDVKVSSLKFTTYRQYINEIAQKTSFIKANGDRIEKLRCKLVTMFKQALEYFQAFRMLKKGIISTIDDNSQRYYNCYVPIKQKNKVKIK